MISDGQRFWISIHALLAESDRARVRARAAEGYFYPRSPCGERPGKHHAVAERHNYFYPRSPCGERPMDGWRGAGNAKFLSTLSLRRATHFSQQHLLSVTFLSTLSLRRATCCSLLKYPCKIFLSTLSLRRATSHVHLVQLLFEIFLSTLSLRRATGSIRPHRLGRGISIHALLAESDVLRVRPAAGRRHFYPRSPCGERRA